eukprot:615828-Alexandrium_andersonii.AAC.1
MADALMGKDGLLNDNFSVAPVGLSETDQLKFFQDIEKAEGLTASINKFKPKKDELWANTEKQL